MQLSGARCVDNGCVILPDNRFVDSDIGGYLPLDNSLLSLIMSSVWLEKRSVTSHTASNVQSYRYILEKQTKA